MGFKTFMAQYESHYQITTLRLKQEMTYREISELFHVSITRIRQKYRRFLWALLRFYCLYIVKITKDNNFKNHMEEVLDFYHIPLYTIAYLETTYKEILDIFRDGFPLVAAIRFPAFRKISPSMENRLMSQVVHARDTDKKDFRTIGQDLDLTREKVISLYDHYYSKHPLKK